MIAFSSLFLALVVGVVNVQLVASEGVDSARLFLDGRPVATLRAPWGAAIDLGPLAPHELVAVALDAKGREVGRARQWVNRPRPYAEAAFVLEPEPNGRERRERVVRLISKCALVAEPRSVSVTYDGAPIPAPDPGRIVLPPHKPGRVHLLRATVEFGTDLVATADAVLGGRRFAETVTELTAVPVSFENEVPPLERLQGALARDGAPLRIAAVEEGPIDVLVVLGGDASDRAYSWFFDERNYRAVGPRAWNRPLGKETTLRLIGPVPVLRAGPVAAVHVFPSSRAVRTDRVGILGLVGGSRLEDIAGPQQIAEAVASAGLLASARNRRRAVVLLCGAETKQGGGLPPAQARRHLEALGVPLRVWSLPQKVPPMAAAFGEVVNVSEASRFASAVDELVRTLDRQRVLWVEGSVPPHEVVPTGRVAGLSIAR